MAKIKQSKLNQIPHYNEFKNQQEEKEEKKEKVVKEEAAKSASPSKNTTTTNTGTKKATIKKEKLEAIPNYKSSNSTQHKTQETAQTYTKRSQYYSQPELWKDKDRLYSAITESEPVVVEKQKQMESVSKRLKELEAALKNNPHDEKAYKEYETAYNGYKALVAEYEPLFNTYTEAVNAYNAYVEDQNGQYNAWRSTVRDAAEIAKDIEALDKQIKSAKYAQHAFSVESREDATGGELLADTAAAYAAELEKLQQDRALLLEEKEWAEHLHYADMMEGDDFEKYTAQGAAIENPEYNDGILGILGLNFGNVGNVVTYSRDNLDAIKANEKASTVGKIVDKLSGGKFISPLDGAGDSIYGYMTEDEVDIYNYLLAKEGEESAKEYLKHLEEYLNARKGKEMGETVRGIDNGILRTGATGAYGLVAGVDQFGSGIKQFVSPKELPTSALQYGSQYIQEDLDDTKVGKYLYGAATTVGNMAPSILVSAITGGLGASAAVAQTVGAATMGVSASGNAYKEKLAEGYSKSQARTYSALVGASEAALQRLLGGIGKLGGVTDDLILAKVGAIDKAWARVALTGAVKLGSEITEEELQLFLEPLFNKWVFGGEYDAPTIEEMAETAIITALSTGTLEAGSIAQAGSNQTSKLGNKINGAGTESLHAIIEEGLATDPSSTSYALAKQLQQKIERGETVTDQEIGNLYRANVENVDTQADPDDALMQAATEAVSNEIGETTTEAPQSASERVSTEEVKVPSEARNVTQEQTSEATAGEQSVPYNVMNTNEPARLSAVQKMRIAERTLAASNYGENGKEAFGAVLKNNPNANPNEVMVRFDTPYQVGLTGTPVEKANFVNDFQKEAYTAGLRDYNIRNAADAQHKPSAILSEADSGFDYTNAPKDLTKSQKDFGNWFLTRMGVKGKFDGYDGVGYNAYYDPDSGITRFAQDFGISPKLMEKLGSMDYQEKVDRLASERGNSFVFYIGHEVAGHVAMDRAPVEMRAFANAMYNYKQGMTKGENLARTKQAFYGSKGKTLDTNAAIEEVISDSILDLYDGDEQAFMDAMYRVFDSTNEDAKKGARKYLEILKDTIAKLKAWVKKLTGKENAQAKENMEQGISELEQLRDMFEKAIAASMKSVQEARANGDVVKSIKDGLGDGSTVQTNKKGDMLIAESKDGSKIAFSYKTYENGGREKLRAALLRNGHTRTEIDSTLALIEDAADYLKILAAGYAKSHNYNALHDHLIADITTNLKTGKQVMSALVNNGDYPVNIDLALICKKRVAYMNLMTRLIEDGIFDMVNYKGEAIADVNDILRANNFETACLGCFVESRRLQFQSWAETIVSEWNDEVSKRKKNAKAFGFSSKNYATLTDAEMDALQAELKNAGKKNKQGNLNLGKGSVKVKIGRLLDKVPSLQQTLTTADLLTPAGLAALRAYDSNLFSIVKSRYGAASPKIVQDFNPYASEIAMMTFKSVSDITSNAVKGAQTYIQQTKKDAGGVPKKQKGESDAAYRKRKAEWNATIENNAMRRYLYDIGGARIQSFSDFMIENVFDYLQIFADLAANRFPLHGYTKEIIALRLFGMSGAKWNGSLIAHTERSMGKEYAGLLPASAAKDGSAILLHTDDGDYAIGFDDYARNKATGGKSFIQSIGIKDIIALQLDPRYSGNVGSITIGVSDKQILAMLDSPLFSMVIPYHSSGMLPGFAQRVGVDMYNDYTDYQNTSVKQMFDANGNRVEELYDSDGEKIKVDTSYAFNEEVQRTGDAREAADNYIKWCAERHPVYDGKNLVGYATFAPKFSDSPYGTDFSRHPNYYKLLEDFNTYDCITGASAVQGPVTMTFPSESNRLSASEMEAYKQRLRDTGIFSEKEIAKYENLANKTFKELIADEVKGRAAYKVTQDAKWEKTVSEIKDKLMSDYARTSAEAIDYVNKAQSRADATTRLYETDGARYSMKELSEEEAPKKVKTAYKLFRVEASRPGEIFPLFVGSDDSVPIGRWIAAEDNESVAALGHWTGTGANKRFVEDKTRRVKSKIGESWLLDPSQFKEWKQGKTYAVGSRVQYNGHVYRTTKKSNFVSNVPPDVKGSGWAQSDTMTTMAYRPGWHSGDAPYLEHIGKKPNGANKVTHYSDNHIWAEVEVPDDIDYQPQANERGMDSNGRIREKFADLDYIPTGGNYEYKTNSNMLGKWVISGAIRVTRILTDAETRQMLATQFADRGLTQRQRMNDAFEVVGDIDLAKYGFEDGKKYSAKGSEIDGYTTRGIDWALDNEVISAKNKADLIRAIDNEIHRGYSIPKDKDGNYIVESGNVMMFTNGDRHNPSLEMVIVLDDQLETLMADAKEEIYNGAKSGDVRGAAETIANVYWDGYASIHLPETYRADENYGRGRKRSVRQILEDEAGTGRNHSLKGEEDMRAELKRIRDEGEKAGKSSAEIDQEIIDAVGQEYGELLKVYGEIQRGEKPAREIKVPSRTGKNRRVSQTIRTILEAQVTPETSVPTIKQMIAEGEFSHDVYTDDAAIANAEDIIRSKTYGVALAEWIRDVENGKVSKTSTALGWALYNEAATANDTETAMTVLNYMVGHQRNAAQAAQATRILKKLTPDAQLYSAVRSVQKLEDDLNKGRTENTEEAKRAAGEVGQAKKEAAAAASKSLSGAKVKRQGNRVTIDSNQAGEPFVFEYAQKVGEAVAKGLEAKRNRTEKERTFLQQITAQLKRFAAEKMPKEKKGKPLTAIDLLRDYIQNQAFYADAWAYAQEELREKYAGDPVFDEFINTGIGVDSNVNPNNAIFMRALVKAAADSGEGRAVLRKQEALGFTGMADTIANNLIEQTGAEGEMAETIRDAAHAYVYSELQADGKDNGKIVDASIRSAMTDIGLKVSEVVNSGTGETAKQAIVDKLVAKYGIGYAEATHTADIVSDRFEQMCRDYSQRRLESMFKERKVSQKTIPEKIEALARLGAFDIGSAYNQKAAERIFKAGVTLTVNEELARQFMQAETQEERDNILADIYRDIGRQMPSTFKDKWNAWRYLAMLGNPRTHVRNVVGNLGFAPVVIAKDATATMIESAVGFVSGGKMGRTKAMPSVKLLKAAWADYANVAAEISAGGKYNDAAIKNQHIEEGRVIFKLKPLEKARKGNSAAMEAEDTWFARPHYAFALAQYCKAHGVTVENLQKGRALGNARAYAIKEAQKATYRDTNAFSQAISELGRYHGDNKVKKAISMVSEGILPFRKTPANILVRGIEYSPVGLLKSLLVDLVKVGKGDMTAAEAIDNISAGLTGTGLLALGVWMAAEGLIRGSGGGEEEEKEFEELQGHQAYSLELPGGTSVTLDWLAPEVLPLFIGVNIAEMARENKGESSMSDILTAVSNVTEPLLEMSCLQSLNDLFDSFGYATSNGLDALPSALISAATSYLTQAFPTILGQAERSAQDERMTTYTEKNNFLTSDMQYLLGKISAKIPGWHYQQIPYVDAWGRTESTGTRAENAANNFLNPAYTSQIETSAMEEELQRLYDATGEKGVLPDRAPKYFTVDKERKDLTAEEYVKYATEKGQSAYDMLSELTSLPEYADMTEAEKVDAVEMVYDYTDAVAKTTISDYEPDGWVAKAIKSEKSGGMDGLDYILYQVALSMVDQPNASGELGGTPTNVEKANAINLRQDLTDYDIANLWNTKDAYDAYDAGIDMRTFVDYNLALDKYDQPTEKGEYGSYNTLERAAAILSLNASDNEMAFLWSLGTTSDEVWDAYNDGVDMDSYISFKKAVEELEPGVDYKKGDTKSRRAAINRVLYGMSLSEHDRNWLYHTEYKK